MTYPVVIAIIGAVITLFFIFIRVVRGGIAGLCMKTAASLGFLATTIAAMSLTGSEKYGWFILGGQIFGLLGDVYLDQKMIHRETDFAYTIMGFTVFGIGHLLFICGIALSAGISELNVIVSLVVAVIITGFLIVTEKPMKLEYGKFKLPVVLYSAVIGFTTALPASYLLTGDALPKSILLFLIGMVLFLLSDLVLSQIYFKKSGETPALVSANYLLYYSAQYLIAISVLFAA